MTYIFLVLILSHVVGKPTLDAGPLRAQAGPCQATELKEYEAEILLYLLPDSSAVRGKGNRVGWELQTNPVLNQADFYIFYLYDAHAPNYGSPTIGYFGVNKHTAEVRDMTSDEFIQSEDLLAVQKILRRGHCIDEQILKEYSPRLPDVRSK